MKLLTKCGPEAGNEIEVVLDFPADEMAFRLIEAVSDTWSIAVYSNGYMKAAITEICLGQLQHLSRQIECHLEKLRLEKMGNPTQTVPCLDCGGDVEVIADPADTDAYGICGACWDKRRGISSSEVTTSKKE